MPPSPQLENGFFRIANELAEALARVNLSPYESRILWFVIRRTYGFNKKMDRISLSQFVGGTGIRQQNIARTLKALLGRQILNVKRESPSRVFYGLQKDYGKWLQPLSLERHSLERLSTQRDSLEITDSLSTETENSLSGETHKRQKTSTKDNGAADAAFETAWKLYPKRAGGNSKENAHAKFNARLRAGIDPAELIAGVERYASYVRATGKENTVYVQQAKTFFGPGEHWKELWEIPAQRQRANGGFVG
ncbi:MAG: replication protein [Deltaproteobacteria bacterium]|nr:replication protein [Deltaproteobacteria bacterium]